MVLEGLLCPTCGSCTKTDPGSLSCLTCEMGTISWAARGRHETDVIKSKGTGLVMGSADFRDDDKTKQLGTQVASGPTSSLQVKWRKVNLTLFLTCPVTLGSNCSHQTISILGSEN